MSGIQAIRSFFSCFANDAIGVPSEDEIIVSLDKEPPAAGKIITIEGNIGSGKSTLLQNLREEYKDDPNVIFLKEPVDEWEKIVDDYDQTMLQKFYGDQERYSFPFQMMAYISRLSLLRNAIKTNPGATIITERSLYTDRFVFAKMLYEMGRMEDVCYQIYLRWFDDFAEECPISKVIYVKADPTTCFDRILNRSRTGEEGIPLNYLENCHEYHENMMKTSEFARDHDLVLDGNIDIFENSDYLKQWITEIKEFIR
uniref:Deoxynucleoside kinase domain-containing protein n=1 Tax=viral metagenome TaxID=1070528 RepID=A0A6C0F446_9ZZZZ